MADYASFEEEVKADAKKNKIFNEIKSINKKNEALTTPGPVVPPTTPAKKPPREFLQAREVAAYTSE
jgi:hypothetical protein